MLHTLQTLLLASPALILAAFLVVTSTAYVVLTALDSR